MSEVQIHSNPIERKQLTKAEEQQLRSLLHRVGPNPLERIRWVSRNLPKVLEEEVKPTRFDRFVDFWFKPAFTYPAIFSLLIAGGFTYYNWDKTANRLAEESFYAESLNNYIKENHSYFSFLGSTNLKVINMVGQDKSSARGQIKWDLKTQKILVNFKELPRAPIGKDYQLWMISGKKWINVGIFREQTFFKISTRNISHFALTVEPKEGSRTPTGPRILTGQI